MVNTTSIRMYSDLPVKMRDGTTLYADLYRPDQEGEFPTILQRTPYDKSSTLSNQMLDPIKAAKAGYAFVIQDTRG